MKPIRTAFTNRLFKLEGGTEENDLPVEACEDEAENTILVSTWELSVDERLKIWKGAKVELLVWGTEHPPVAIRIANRENEQDAPMEVPAHEATT